MTTIAWYLIEKDYFIPPIMKHIFLYPSLGLKSSLSQNISALLNFNVLYTYLKISAKLTYIKQKRAQ